MPANLGSRLILAATLAWTQVLHLSPYVLSGILLAALLSRLDLSSRWRSCLNRKGPEAIVGAACLGGVSPLCTYGTVPVLSELLRGGASPGPAVSFLIASSLLNPQLFIVMIGGLGWRLALAHAAGVLLLSVPAGILASRLRPEVFLNKGTVPTPPSAEKTPEGGQGKKKLVPHLLHLTERVGLYFAVGISLTALLQVLLPSEWISSLLSASRWHGILLAGVLGIPLYACGGGAVPLISGLLAQGLSPGAALTFFLVGPATRLTSLAALGTLLNRRALAVYVAYVVTIAIMLGLAWT